eukprot:6381499-Prymnesium_polylepis.1
MGAAGARQVVNVRGKETAPRGGRPPPRPQLVHVGEGRLTQRASASPRELDGRTASARDISIALSGDRIPRGPSDRQRRERARVKVLGEREWSMLFRTLGNLRCKRHSHIEHVAL